MRIRRLLLQVVAYTLYAMAAFVVFLYLTFPYDLLRQHLVARASQAGATLTLGHLGPAFPPGLRVQGVRLVVDQVHPTDTVVHIATLRLQPEWMALLTRTPRARFEAGLYGGRLEGEVGYAPVEGAPLWNVQARFADLDVAQHPLARQGETAFVRGRLSGDATVMLTGDGLMRDGNVNLRLQPLILAGAPGWAVQLPREVACDTLQGEIRTASRQGSNVVLTCQGKDLALEARGTVAWKAPVTDSQLSLRCQVRSEEAYKQEVEILSALVRKRPDRRGELSFRLQGPLRQLRLGA